MVDLSCLAQASCGLCHQTEEVAANQMRVKVETGSPQLKKMAMKAPANGNMNCKDSDSRCGAWAQMGECLKNPSFMLRTCKVGIGSLIVHHSSELLSAHLGILLCTCMFPSGMEIKLFVLRLTSCCHWFVHY